jgi:hypothetical protein
MEILKDQSQAARIEIMVKLFASAFSNVPIKGMEIGVWYGLGSTKIWLENCHANSELYLLDSWKPYASVEDLTQDSAAYHYKGMDDLSTDAFLSSYLNIKRVEESRRQDNVKVHMIRGDSATILDSFKSDIFDFIYLDGDHKYEKVKSDIQQSKRLIKKDFGIICGDDLEKLPTKELYKQAKQHPNRDYLRGEEGNFHPGVLAAVHEEFEKVSMVSGFWWVICLNGKFTDLL